jgi:hypothetical protein
MIDQNYLRNVEVPVPLSNPSAPTVVVDRPDAISDVAVTVDGTDDDETYEYAVVAVTADGRRSLPDDDTTTDGPTALGEEETITVTWTDVTGATEYHVYRLAGGPDQGLIAVVAAGVEEYVDEGGAAIGGGLETPDAYEYKIVALDGQRRPTAASTAGAETDGYEDPGGARGNRITWSAVTGAVYYQVWRTDGGDSLGLIAEQLATADRELFDNGLAGDGATAPAANVTNVGVPSLMGRLTPQIIQYTTFTGSLQLSGTYDGVTWVNVGSAATGAAAVALDKPWNALRVTVGSLTGDPPTVTVTGR